MDTNFQKWCTLLGHEREYPPITHHTPTAHKVSIVPYTVEEEKRSYYTLYCTLYRPSSQVTKGPRNVLHNPLQFYAVEFLLNYRASNAAHVHRFQFPEAAVPECCITFRMTVRLPDGQESCSFSPNYFFNLLTPPK